MKLTRSFRIAALVCLAAGLLAATAQANRPQTAPPPNAPPNAADMKEFYNYTITMDKIRRLATIERDLDAAQKADPQLRQSLENDNAGSDANLNQAAQRLQKYPQAVSIMKKNGMTPHEYIVGTVAFIQAVTAVGFKKNGTYKDYPPQVRQVISPVNIAFVEQHWDEIAKIMPTFSGEGDKGKP